MTDQLSKIDRSAWVTPEHGQIPWRTYSEQLLAGRVHLAARTIETDRLCHERAVTWIGDVSLAHLKPERINPSYQVIDFLVNEAKKIKVRAEREKVEA